MKRLLGVALSVIAVACVVAVALVLTGVWSPPWIVEAKTEAPGSVSVSQGKDVALPSHNGSPEVQIPATAFTGDGLLEIRPVALSEDRHGWSIELSGARLTGQATLVFKDVVAEGTPPPLVGFNQNPTDEIQYVLDTEVSGKDLVVRTAHFSNWVTVSWDWLTNFARGQLDRIYNDSGSGEQPQCDLEAEARSNGVSVTSDGGGRVQWCMGIAADGSTVLKVNNSRGYAVSAESTPNLTLETRSLDFGQMVPRLAKYITAPSKRGNVIDIIGPGETVEYKVDTASEVKGVRLQPSPPAYLATALWFGIQTAVMVAEETNVLGKLPYEKIQQGVDAVDCAAGLQGTGTVDVTDAKAAGNYLNTATGMVMSCMGKVFEDIAKHGPPEEVLKNLVVLKLAHVMGWLWSGIQTAANGFAAAADTALNFNGYTISLAYPAAPTATPSPPAISSIPGLPDALSGKWCTRSTPTKCFSGTETKANSPTAQVESAGSSERVPGATDYTICVRLDLGNRCTTASSIYLRYFPAGTIWDCGRMLAAEEYRWPACEPDYTSAHDSSQPRLIIRPNHQQAPNYIDSPPMYRTQ